MKIFDCFMYFDEEAVCEIRLNCLNKYVDYFVIVESTFTHKGEKRELKFNHQKFNKFKDKIIYLVYDKEPKNIRPITKDDTQIIKLEKNIINAGHRENGQRNFIDLGLKNAEKNDIILLSDVDEIPNLKDINFSEIDNKIILFKQDMFYYKFNLVLPNFVWVGTKCCRKKDFKNAQWLRNIKDKNYPFYRLDILFSKLKYTNMKFIENGGWHFSNIKTPEEIRYKLTSYLHHGEFDENPLSVNQIQQIIKSKRAIYDLKADQRSNKIGFNGNELVKYPIDKLPKYLKDNLNNFENWID